MKLSAINTVMIDFLALLSVFSLIRNVAIAVDLGQGG
jgi:hypothetical protein